MRLSISAKIFLGFAAVIASFGTVSVFAVVRMHHIANGLALVTQSYQPLTRLGAQLESSHRSSEQATQRLLGERDVRTQRALLVLARDYHPRATREKVRAAQQVIQAARERSPGDAELAFLDRIDGLLSAALLRYDEYARAGEAVERIIDRLEKPRGEELAALRNELDAEVRRLKKIEAAIVARFNDFSGELEQRIDLRVHEAGREERATALFVIVFSLAAMAAGLGVTAFAQRTVAPVRRLTEAVKAVGEGRSAPEIDVRADDEVGVLAREFNDMARKLADRERQLSEKTAELLRSERFAAIGRLASQITHEIRNPLASLSLNAELLEEQMREGTLDSPEDREEARSILAAMAREVERLTEVTEEYLVFARLPRAAVEPVDLGEEVEEILDFVEPELRAAGVRLERDRPAGSLQALADRGQLRQVLLNLVRNAREASSRGGRIAVRVRAAPPQRVALEVEDEGPGVPEEIRARVFEPFFSTKERGTGLGLALVQQIAHEHGGEVECGVAAAGGARFTVLLRAAPPATGLPDSGGLGAASAIGVREVA